MNRQMLCSVLILLLTGGRAAAALTIDLGTQQMLPNSQGQIIVSVSGGDAIAGMNFAVQVGNSGSQPAITGIDIIGRGTMFFGKNTGALPQQVGDPRTWVDATTVDETTGTLPAAGAIAIVTVDTTGTLVANYIHAHRLVLNPGSVVILGGVSAAAAAVDPGGNVASSYAVGSAGVGAATVPEPSTFALLGAGAIAMLAYVYRQRKRAP